MDVVPGIVVTFGRFRHASATSSFFSIVGGIKLLSRDCEFLHYRHTAATSNVKFKLSLSSPPNLKFDSGSDLNVFCRRKKLWCCSVLNNCHELSFPVQRITSRCTGALSIQPRLDKDSISQREPPEISLSAVQTGAFLRVRGRRLNCPDTDLGRFNSGNKHNRKPPLRLPRSVGRFMPETASWAAKPHVRGPRNLGESSISAPRRPSGSPAPGSGNRDPSALFIDVDRPQRLTGDRRATGDNKEVPRRHSSVVTSRHSDLHRQKISRKTRKISWGRFRLNLCTCAITSAGAENSPDGAHRSGSKDQIRQFVPASDGSGSRLDRSSGDRSGDRSRSRLIGERAPRAFSPFFVFSRLSPSRRPPPALDAAFPPAPSGEIAKDSPRAVRHRTCNSLSKPATWKQLFSVWLRECILSVSSGLGQWEGEAGRPTPRRANDERGAGTIVAIKIMETVDYENTNMTRGSRPGIFNFFNEINDSQTRDHYSPGYAPILTWTKFTLDKERHVWQLIELSHHRILRPFILRLINRPPPPPAAKIPHSAPASSLVVSQRHFYLIIKPVQRPPPAPASKRAIFVSTVPDNISRPLFVHYANK
ncbi:hypothetical protein GEV33_012356 [Tenebrio molitor]|uniref:Uncharacterized protein n=1 Tax=Tenebrio molitor TaxID=7067 RepID=A0A8J6H978_TENMO|nr:hypothetical protein GEV33_012356 [Tenebrio molitor]